MEMQHFGVPITVFDINRLKEIVNSQDGSKINLIQQEHELILRNFMQNKLMVANRIIQSLWIGNSLTNNEILCLKSYMNNGHEFHLYTYNKITNLPDGVKICNANSIIHKSKIFMDSRGGIASFSDWFRYKLLYKRGGWWVDMDSVCIRFFDVPNKYCFSTERQVNNNGSLVNIGTIKSPKGAKFLKDCISYIEDKLDQNIINNTVIPYGLFGNRLFRYVLNHYPAEEYIKNPEVFCPIDYFNTEFLIESSDYVPAKNTLAIHLWNEMWRIKSIDKNGAYSIESIYEKMKSLYCRL